MKMQGLKVAISISDAPDRMRLGLPEREVDRALMTICTALIREGAEILYAGNLSPDQYTFKIFRHLAGVYAGTRDVAPFVHVIPEPIVRTVSFVHLHSALRENGTVTQTFLSFGSELLKVRTSGPALLLRAHDGTPEAVGSDDEWRRWLGRRPVTPRIAAYTAARKAVTNAADARVALGGKMGLEAQKSDQYEGDMPGIAEEALMALDAGLPMVALGAYGGAARDVAISLGLLGVERRVPRGTQHASYVPAMNAVAERAACIPGPVRSALRAIADDDRGEPTAFAIVAAILAWRDAANATARTL